MNKLNEILLYTYYYYNIYIHRPDYIWICYPSHQQYIPKSNAYKIIYDCMDDAPEFIVMDQEEKRRMLMRENDLVGKSEIVFVSSENLKKC